MFFYHLPSNKNIQGNLESHKLKIYSVSTQDELDDVLNNVHKRYSNLFYYQFLLSVNVGHLSLNGGTWLVEGYLAAEGRYGTQTIRLYSSNILDERHRSLRNEIWTDWCNTITNSNLPIMESHLVDPNGSNTIKINLQNNTTVERVQVTLASLIDLQISGMTIRAGTYNTVEIILSKTYSGTIRVNVLYYKT